MRTAAFYASEEFLRPDVGDFKDLDDFLEVRAKIDFKDSSRSLKSH
jgi:hypothetical protein